MTSSRTTLAASRLPPDPVALHDRLGSRLGAALTERCEQDAAGLSHDVTERLRFAREQALARARERRAATQSAPAAAVHAIPLGRQLAWQQPPAWLTRLASLMPLVVLVAGLVVIDEWYDRAQIRAAADVDVALLTDDLPVDAYSDPGFVEFLKHPQE